MEAIALYFVFYESFQVIIYILFSYFFTTLINDNDHPPLYPFLHHQPHPLNVTAVSMKRCCVDSNAMDVHVHNLYMVLSADNNINGIDSCL